MKLTKISSSKKPIGFLTFVIFFAAAITIPKAAFSQVAIELPLDLGTLGGNQSEATAVNDLGQVVGNSRYTLSSYNCHAFLWTKEGGMVDLGTLGGNHSVAHDINNAGQVVGGSYNASGQWHAFVWTKDTGMIDIGTLDGSSSEALGINNVGQVVGWSNFAPGDWQAHAFLWSQADGMVDIGTLGGSLTYGTAGALNDLGQVVGWSRDVSSQQGVYHGFYWSKEDGMIDVGTMTGIKSMATDINNAGQVVGSIDGNIIFIWTKDGVMVTPTFAIGGYDVAINNLGQIAAASYYHPGAGVWSEMDGAMFLPLWRDVDRAADINNVGQVVGWSYTAADRQQHACLWTVPCFLAPQAQIDLIIGKIGDLVESGVLNKGQGNSLIQKLDHAKSMLASGKIAQACNLLNAFVAQVNDLIINEVLSPAEGQPLIAAANVLIAQICG